MILPLIALPEVAAALARGTGNPDSALDAVWLYRGWPGVRIVAVSEELGDPAVDIAAGHGIRRCDAVYVALVGAMGAVLVTLDRRQRERAPKSMSSHRALRSIDWRRHNTEPSTRAVGSSFSANSSGFRPSLTRSTIWRPTHRDTVGGVSVASGPGRGWHRHRPHEQSENRRTSSLIHRRGHE